jgi:hypothetical protein
MKIPRGEKKTLAKKRSKSAANVGAACKCTLRDGFIYRTRCPNRRHENNSFPIFLCQNRLLFADCFSAVLVAHLRMEYCLWNVSNHADERAVVEERGEAGQFS